jgi:molybdenum cofactor biosynthesis protein MoaC
MIDISDKTRTLRMAKAQAIVKVSPETMERIRRKEVPKGDVVEISRSVALLSAKKMPEMLPFCHNIPIEWIGVEIFMGDDEIKIEVTVKSIYKTGCEMEALFSAACAALNIYDMLKPIDKQIEIQHIRLLEKWGGKSDYVDKVPVEFKAGVLVISNSIFQGKKEDKAGKMIVEKLSSFQIKNIEYKVIPDDVDMIRDEILRWCDDGFNLIVTAGGTGLAPSDRTPEAVRPLIEREIPGIMEAARGYGQERTPYAMFSRGLAGLRGETLIICLPGSSRGVEESISALFPYVFRIFKMLKIK